MRPLSHSLPLPRRWALISLLVSALSIPHFPILVLHISLLIALISSHTFSTIHHMSSIVSKLTFRHNHLNLNLLNAVPHCHTIRFIPMNYLQPIALIPFQPYQVMILCLCTRLSHCHPLGCHGGTVALTLAGEVKIGHPCPEMTMVAGHSPGKTITIWGFQSSIVMVSGLGRLNLSTLRNTSNQIFCS